jgi:hypothetical protein
MNRLRFIAFLFTTAMLCSCGGAWNSDSIALVGTWTTYSVSEVAPLPQSETLEETPYAVRSIQFTEKGVTATYGTYNYKTKQWSNLHNEYYDRYSIDDATHAIIIVLWQGSASNNSFSYDEGELKYYAKGKTGDYSITQCLLRKQ